MIVNKVKNNTNIKQYKNTIKIKCYEPTTIY